MYTPRCLGSVLHEETVRERSAQPGCDCTAETTRRMSKEKGRTVQDTLATGPVRSVNFCVCSLRHRP